MHEYYRSSGEVAKEIENYEKNLPERKEKIFPPAPAKKEPENHLESLEEQKLGFSLPFSQITEVVEESPSFIAGRYLNYC